MTDSIKTVTVPGGSQFFYDTVGSPDKTLKMYKGHFHDLLNDVGRDTVIADIIGWIDTRLAAPNAQRLAS